MKKRIIIISVLVVALVGAYIAVNRLSVNEDNVPEPAPVETASISKTEVDNIISMTVSTPDYEYKFGRDGDLWKVEGKESIKLNNSKINSLAYDFASINADTVIEDTGDLSVYGLDSPLGTPSIRLNDGSEQKFLIGSKTPIGTGYYFKKADDNSVYTVYSSKIEGFLARLEEYRDKTLATVDASKLTEIRIKRSDADIALRAKTQAEAAGEAQSFNPWKMISPYSRDANSYNLEEQLLKKIAAFEISRFIDDSPVSYAKYGLDNPKYVIGFTEQEKEPVSISLGSEDGDETYVRLAGDNAVYSVKTSAFAFKDVNPMDLVDLLAYIQMIDKVNSITLTSDDAVYVFKIAREGENTSYYINDASADESAFKKAYQEVIGLLIRGKVDGQLNEQPICTAVFSFNDGRADDVVEAVPYRDRYAAVRINGRSEYYVMREQVYGMLEKIKSFSQNPENR